MILSVASSKDQFSQFISVAQLCPALCNPMDCSTSGFPVHHQLLEPIPTHLHHVSDAIQSSHPLLSPSPPTFSLFQHQGLFQWASFFASSGQSIGASASASVLLMNIQDWFLLGWTGWISLLSKRLSRLFSHTTVWRHQFFSAQHFFIVQLSYLYMTTGKTIALTIWTSVGKVMSLLFNTLSRLVSISSKKQVSFNFMAEVTICSDFGTQENKVCHCISLFAMKW